MCNNIELHRYLIVLTVFFMSQVVHANSYIGEDFTEHRFFRTAETSHYNGINTTSFYHPSVSQFTSHYATGSAISDVGSYKGFQQINLQYIPTIQRISEYKSGFPDLSEPSVLSLITIGLFGISVVRRRRDETVVCCF